MAEESKIVSNEEVSVETTDRGLFDCMGKKEEKPIKEEPEKPKVEEEKKEEILGKQPAAPEEKNGILEKIKEKLPGQHKNSEEVPPPAPAEVCSGDSKEKAEKKGIMEKIKEKLPGHPKSDEEMKH